MTAAVVVVWLGSKDGWGERQHRIEILVRLRLDRLDSREREKGVGGIRNK